MGRPTPVLTTGRLTLSAPTVEDADALFPFVHGDPGRVVTDMLLWDGPADIEELRERYRDYQPREEDGSVTFQWAIRDREGSLTGEAGIAVGSIGLRVPTQPAVAEFGYWIAPPYWRQGLMSEAISAVVAYAFDESAATSVRADVFTTNQASRRLLENLGFQNVARLPDAHVKRGRPMDCYRYEVYRQE